MLKVIPESHGMFALKPKDEQSLSESEESLCKLVDMNLRLGNLYGGAVAKFRRIAEEVESGTIAPDEGLKKAQNLDSDIEAAKKEFRKPQFSVKAVDRDRQEIDSHNYDKAYDIDIHAEDVAVSEEKRKFEVEAERTLAIVRKVVEPDRDATGNAGRATARQPTHEIRKKRSKYIHELTGICHVGLEHEDPSQITLASEALKAFREEFVTNEQGIVKNRYIRRLALPCALTSAVALVAYILAHEIGSVQNARFAYLTDALYSYRNFFLLFVGAGVGTWLSFTLRKPTLTFVDLVALEEDSLDPGVRVAFVSLLTFVVGLLFWTKVLTVELGGLSISSTTFNENGMSVLLIGVLLGIAERTMSSAVLKRATGFGDAIGGKKA